MPIEEIKQKLRELIETSNNGAMLEDLLMEAQSRSGAVSPHETEGLSKEDCEELTMLAKEDPLKDTVSYDELKDSLNRWFTN